jgi:hypothetical protein
MAPVSDAQPSQSSLDGLGTKSVSYGQFPTHLNREFFAAYRELDRAIREIFALIRESRSRLLFGACALPTIRSNGFPVSHATGNHPQPLDFSVRFQDQSAVARAAIDEIPGYFPVRPGKCFRRGTYSALF